ncbi:MAG: hypothetical protein F6K31_28340 [Symploca sp. SIO2G7]|nr:hypothetical protein [Symploca sp. SIO2G7]
MDNLGDLTRYKRGHPVEELRRNRESLYSVMFKMAFSLIESTDLPEEEKALQQVRTWLRDALDVHRRLYERDKALHEHYAKKEGNIES